jgi:hypothetical protein
LKILTIEYEYITRIAPQNAWPYLKR